MAPALPTVYLPTPASITATLGDPTGMESQVIVADAGSFTSASLPVVEPSIGGVYRTASNSAATASNQMALSQAASEQAQTIYQQANSYSAIEVATVPSARAENGLPALGPSSARETSIGTAILQDLQVMQAAQAAPASPVQADAGSIDIDIVSAEAAAPTEDLVASASDGRDVVESVTANNGPTLEDLTRSMVVRDLSPLVAYASQTGEASLAMEAIARSTPHTDAPTLESLLETMPRTAAQPNFAVDLSDGNAASPLLEGLSNAEPLSTLYMPIPDAASEDTVSSNGSRNDADASLLTNVNLIKGSLASLADMLPAAKSPHDSLSGMLAASAGQSTSLQRSALDSVLHQRNKAILSLVEKSSTKRRQLVAY